MADSSSASCSRPSEPTRVALANGPRRTFARQAFDSFASRKAVRILFRKSASLDAASASIRLFEVLSAARTELIPHNPARMTDRPRRVGLIDVVAEPNSAIVERQYAFAAFRRLFHAPREVQTRVRSNFGANRPLRSLEMAVSASRHGATQIVFCASRHGATASQARIPNCPLNCKLPIPTVHCALPIVH